MHSNPRRAVVVTEFEMDLVPGVKTPCRVYHAEPNASDEAPPNPGTAPDPVPDFDVKESFDPKAMEKFRKWVADKRKYEEDLALYQKLSARCQKWQERQRDQSPPQLIFTHGRGSTLDHLPSMAFCEGFARSQNILAFECKLNNHGRATVFRAALNHYFGYDANPLVAFGGRSKGAHAAAGAINYTNVKKLIFSTFPLVRGRDHRVQELLSLSADTNVLWISGDDDPLSVAALLDYWRARIKAKIWWIKLREGDHSLEYRHVGDTWQYRAKSICNIVGQLAAHWNVNYETLPGTELTVDWVAEQNKPKWTEWTPYTPPPTTGPTTFSIDVLNRNMYGGGGNFSFTL